MLKLKVNKNEIDTIYQKSTDVATTQNEDKVVIYIAHKIENIHWDFQRQRDHCLP